MDRRMKREKINKLFIVIDCMLISKIGQNQGKKIWVFENQ